MGLGYPLEIGVLLLALALPAGHHILKAQIALGLRRLGLPDPAGIGTAAPLGGTGTTGPAGRTLRRGQGALDGKRDLAVLRNVDNLDLDRLALDRKSVV